jgi:hypothetical protein
LVGENERRSFGLNPARAVQHLEILQEIVCVVRPAQIRNQKKEFIFQ